MKKEYLELLKSKCSGGSFDKLSVIENEKLHDFVGKYVEVCNPDSVFVCTDSLEDVEYIRFKAIEKGEELPLKTEGHTIHFDGYYDQARDKAKTKYLLEPGQILGPDINSEEKDKGLEEVHGFLKDSMVGNEMFVCFFCLGPTDSEFSISAVQITDSSYVAHSEGILYRSGYEQFTKLTDPAKFFRFVHTAGKLENGVSVEVDKRRVYIDLDEEIVFSTNTQYAGNTVGLKKLSMRLAIKRASEEGWLTEHMFLMGVYGTDKKRLTYFSGSFPSACGKTATSMLEGERIVGDDIAYLRSIDGVIRAVNVEKGIFGIIKDVSEKSDPAIFNALTEPGEVIYSNILKDKESNPRWLNDGREEPTEGINFAGTWTPCMTGPDGKEVLHAHKNARYTINIKDLENCDENLDNPEGVEVGGIIYGGRDSDTNVPIVQSFDWVHGILTQASTIESETTAATLGAEGVRAFNLMANIDFISIPMGKYIQNNLDIVNRVKKAPLVFHVNYFLRGKNGEFLNGIKDKHVWIKWMEKRVHNKLDAIRTPIGFIPKYEDIAPIFKELLDKDYTLEHYEEQFKLRIPESITKIERIKKIYQTKVSDAPEVLIKALDEQKTRLEECQKAHGDYVFPSVLAG